MPVELTLTRSKIIECRVRFIEELCAASMAYIFSDLTGTFHISAVTGNVSVPSNSKLSALLIWTCYTAESQPEFSTVYFLSMISSTILLSHSILDPNYTLAPNQLLC